jgi:hypothetical protein
MYHKIYVTADEMLRMRENGMSNHDIAKSLGISSNTVRKYIGKQDGHMEGYAAFKNTPPRQKMETKEDVPVIPKYEPKPIFEQFEIGECTVELDRPARLVTVGTKDSGDIIISYDSIPDLVQFLAWAMRERMEVTADAEADQVRESSCYPEREEV